MSKLQKPTEIMTKTLSPRDLAREKYIAYKAYIRDVFMKCAECTGNEQFQQIVDMTAPSPAGDGYGKDNRFIDFGFDENQKDIFEALNYLEYLRRYANGDIELDEKFYEGMEFLDAKD